MHSIVQPAPSGVGWTQGSASHEEIQAKVGGMFLPRLGHKRLTSVLPAPLPVLSGSYEVLSLKKQVEGPTWQRTERGL